MSRIAKAAAVTAAAGAVLVGSAGSSSAYDGAQGIAAGNPGVVSGNVIQVPINIPINACGNTVDVIGVLNPAFGNVCINDFGRHHYEKKDHDKKHDGGKKDDHRGGHDGGKRDDHRGGHNGGGHNGGGH
ncbi:chaplin [Streptomyces megasporus]|uniref:chaplin n=1 Tax=Streptomyces megasporus TaxID=44060 RepID=UPI0004E212FA